MAAFGAVKAGMLRPFLALPHGAPSHDTFSRLFRLLDPERFERAFAIFMSRFAATVSGQVGTAGQVVALDGKALKGAKQAGQPTAPLQLVTAWAVEQRLVLGCRKAPGGSEVTAAREIIGLLDLTATTVTADALHGNRETAAAIRARGGDYVLAIKGNRGPLHRKIIEAFAEPDTDQVAITTEKAHGRHEERRAWVLPVGETWPQALGFEGLRAIARIDSTRKIGTAESNDTRYYALSRALDPAEALRVVRAHWTIENNQHWILDVALGEDRANTRNDRTAENLALLRRLALNLVRADPTKGSMRLKLKRAGWDDTFLLSLLRQMR